MPGTSCTLDIDPPRRCFPQQASLSTWSLHGVAALRLQAAPHRSWDWFREQCRPLDNPRPNHLLDRGRQDFPSWQPTSPFPPINLSPSLAFRLLNIYIYITLFSSHLIHLLQVSTNQLHNTQDITLPCVGQNKYNKDETRKYFG